MTEGKTVFSRVVKDTFQERLVAVLSHPFLHYHPYLKEDEIIVADAIQRSYSFERNSLDLLTAMSSFCCTCRIQQLQEAENPYTVEQDSITYQYLTVSVPRLNKDSLDISINKSDFNPRYYLSEINPNLMSFVKVSVERMSICDDERVKLASTVDDGAEIEECENTDVLMAYYLPCMSGFGKLKTAYRFYTFSEYPKAHVIREQILRTQQVILARIIKNPLILCPLNTNDFNDEIFSMFLPDFHSLFNAVTCEMKARNIDSLLKDELNITNYKTTQEISEDGEPFESIITHEAMLLLKKRITFISNDFGHTSKFIGNFAIVNDYCNYYLIDRNGYQIMPRFKQKTDIIQQASLFETFSFHTIINARKLTASQFDENTFSPYIIMYANPEVDMIPVCNDCTDENCIERSVEGSSFYAGVINEYGYIIAEFRSMYSLENKLEFEMLNSHYIVYNEKKEGNIKYGIIDLKKGKVICHPCFLREQIEQMQLNYSIEAPAKGWIKGREGFYYRGAIIHDPDDNLYIDGDYCGMSLRDILSVAPNILVLYVYKEQVLLCDKVFNSAPNNMSLTEKLIRRFQEKHLFFSPINRREDLIFGYLERGHGEMIELTSTYEGKTIESVVTEYNDAAYLMYMLNNSNLEISEDLAENLYRIYEDSEEYAPSFEELWNKIREIKNAWEEQMREAEENMLWQMEQDDIEQANQDFYGLMDDYEATS